MTDRQQLIVKNVDAAREIILAAERWLWAHPQTGYQEWEAHGYLVEKFKELGYELTLAGSIPGFYTDVDTGLPGPKLCIMGELDALDIASHPEAVNGAVHACGHHGQGAALLGIAAALKRPGALDGLCGSIRLMAVPAEEGIQIPFREELRKKGVIRYHHGKPEFMARGYFDGVDIAILVHGETGLDHLEFNSILGRNGLILKEAVYKGAAVHAGSSPHRGINAQYAAMLGLQACNDLRETYQEKETVRFHPVMRGWDGAVNVIPDEVHIESMVRGRTLEAIARENRKINRALAAGALAMGARLEIHDRAGSAPEYHDPALMRLTEACCVDLAGREKVDFGYDRWSTGSSDFGHVTCVMPGIQFHASGASGAAHGTDFVVTDAERLCVNSAKAQLFLADALLCDDGVRAKEIIAGYRPEYPSIEAYIKSLDQFDVDKEAVIYNEDGTITVDCI